MDLESSSHSPEPPQASVARPFVAVSIVGGLVVTFGVASLAAMVFGLLRGKFLFDLGFLAIPFGYGLFKGSRNSRAVVLIFSSIIFVISLATGIAVVYRYFSGSEPLRGTDAIVSVGFLLLVMSGCGLMFYLLRRPDVRAWFEARKPFRADERSLATPILVVAGFLLTIQGLCAWWLAETLSDLYHIETTIVLYDEDSGERTRSVGFHLDSSNGNGPHLGLPPLNVGYTTTLDGTEVRIEGIAAGPVYATITSDGYRDERIRIDRHTDEELRVGMKPVADETLRVEGGSQSVTAAGR